MKLAVKDYQIIKSASLEFIPGLNVIIGPSNNGKTSILKALKALVYTVPGTTSIRAGQPSYTVGVTYNNHTVILQKGMKESVYLLDGEKYTKFGQTTPEAISKALNIKELVLNGNKEQLNFWDQMNYPFLLDKTPVELFRFIIDSGDDDQISSALKDMVSDRQSKSKEIDMLQGSINLIDDELSNLENTIKESEPIQEACNGIISLQPRISKLNRLKELKSKLDNISIEKSNVDTQTVKPMNRLVVYKNNLAGIDIDLYRLTKYNSLFSRLHVNIEDQSDINEASLKLAYLKIVKPIDLSDVTRLKNYREKINYISQQKNNIRIKPGASWNSENVQSNINLINKYKSILKTHSDTDYKSVNLGTEICIYNTRLKNIDDVKNCFKLCPYCGQKIHN